jgi:hypothetical protein
VVAEGTEAARGIAASHVAWYLSAMGDVYARSVSDQGYGAEVDAVRAASPRPSPHRGVVPAEAEVLLDQFAAYGTAGQVRDRLASWGGAVDIVMVGLPAGVPWPTIEAPSGPRRPEPAVMPGAEPAEGSVAVAPTGFEPALPP